MKKSKSPIYTPIGDSFSPDFDCGPAPICLCSAIQSCRYCYDYKFPKPSKKKMSPQNNEITKKLNKVLDIYQERINRLLQLLHEFRTIEDLDIAVAFEQKVEEILAEAESCNWEQKI